MSDRMPIFLHMHDGEPVYYTDVCEVCERERSGEIPVSRSEMPLPDMPEPGTSAEVPEFYDEIYPEENRKAVHYPQRRYISGYAIGNFFTVLTKLGIMFGTWLLVFMMISLILHGTVKW